MSLNFADQKSSLNFMHFGRLVNPTSLKAHLGWRKHIPKLLYFLFHLLTEHQPYKADEQVPASFMMELSLIGLPNVLGQQQTGIFADPELS